MYIDLERETNLQIFSNNNIQSMAVGIETKDSDKYFLDYKSAMQTDTIVFDMTRRISTSKKKLCKTFSPFPVFWDTIKVRLSYLETGIHITVFLSVSNYFLTEGRNAISTFERNNKHFSKIIHLDTNYFLEKKNIIRVTVCYSGTVIKVIFSYIYHSLKDSIS